MHDELHRLQRATILSTIATVLAVLIAGSAAAWSILRRSAQGPDPSSLLLIVALFVIASVAGLIAVMRLVVAATDAAGRWQRATGVVILAAVLAVFFAVAAATWSISRGAVQRADLGSFLLIVALLCIIAIVAGLIALGDGAVLARAAEVATVAIPVAGCSEIFAYLFNRGWAWYFSVPVWLVPWSSSLETVAIMGLILTVGLVAIVRFIPKADQLLDELKKYKFPIAHEHRVPAYWWLGILLVVSPLAGWLVPFSTWSPWSYIDKACVVVAVFGDTVVAADVNFNRETANDFTVYHSDSVPQFWQSQGWLRHAARTDSEEHHRPIMECPKAVEPPKAGAAAPKRPHR